MEQKTLKYLRVFIPGLLILLGSYPIHDNIIGSAFDIKSLDITYLTYLSILLGAIYYQLNIGHFISKPSHHFIQKNILNKLIEASKIGQVDKDQRKSLKMKGNFMRVFYKIIDNDESLKRKGENVRFNGIFWTSTADSFIISSAFHVYYLNSSETCKSPVLTRIFLYTAIISLILHIITVVKHIRLSNEQLNSIIQDEELASIANKEFTKILH